MKTVSFFLFFASFSHLLIIIFSITSNSVILDWGSEEQPYDIPLCDPIATGKLGMVWKAKERATRKLFIYLFIFFLIFFFFCVCV